VGIARLWEIVFDSLPALAIAVQQSLKDKVDHRIAVINIVALLSALRAFVNG